MWNVWLFFLVTFCILMVFHMPCPTNLYNLRTLKPPSKLDNTDNSSFIINSSSASLTGRFRDNNPVYAIIIKLNVWFIPSIATRKNGRLHFLEFWYDMISDGPSKKMLLVCTTTLLYINSAVGCTVIFYS